MIERVVIRPHNSVAEFHSYSQWSLYALMPHCAPLLTTLTHSVSTTFHLTYSKVIHNFGTYPFSSQKLLWPLQLHEIQPRQSWSRKELFPTNAAPRSKRAIRFAYR